jgi:hypothetical protein
MRTVLVAIVLLAVPARAAERTCWDKRIQLWVPCSHLANPDALLPGKECWHADYQAFDTCRSESFKPGYRHDPTPREECEAAGKRLDPETGNCI